MAAVWRTLGILARTFVGAGLLLLLFTAYQIWGTAWSESHEQSTLRAKIQHEIPAKLRHDAAPKPVSNSGPAKVAAPGDVPAEGQPVGILRIPSIGLDQVVVQGTGDNDLTKGPGHYLDTPLPGQAGNSAIAGHRTTWGHPFYSLNAVPVGAPVYITTPQGAFTYTTKSVKVVSPDDNAVLASTSAPSITLTTCNPLYSASQRLILRGQLTASRLVGAASHSVAPTPKPPPKTSLAGTTSGTWWSVALWGLGVIALGVALWGVGQRTHRRWLIYLAGTPVVLVLLYFFFGAISPHLPASF